MRIPLYQVDAFTSRLFGGNRLDLRLGCVNVADAQSRDQALRGRCDVNAMLRRVLRERRQRLIQQKTVNVILDQCYPVPLHDLSQGLPPRHRHRRGGRVV